LFEKEPRMSDAFDADAFNRFEHHGWETNSADAFQEVFGPITSLSIDDLLNDAAVHKGARVLDVATGPGYVAARAGDRGARVSGVDLSEQMLAVARRRYPAIEFIKGDAEELPFPEASFDAVVANFCILHLGRPERAAAGFARVLKPGGLAALTAWDYPQHCPMLGDITEAVRAAGVVAPPSLPAGPDFFRFASESEFSTLLREAGLEDIRVRTLSFEHRISSADALWHGFAEGGVRNRALLMLQPEDVRRRIQSEFTRRLESFRSGEGFNLPVSIKLASGSKPIGKR
jgi:SAM-dependent methyltransferase